ncbi:MAG: toxin [Desulfobulbaceae bacterium]|nr:toxin [Desulfobulbaceae bacterium]
MSATTQTPKYTFFATDHFQTRLKRIKRRDPSGYLRIRQVINRVLENPAEADGKMIGLHHGRLKKYVGRGEYRLIYYYCEKCIKANERLSEDCGYCTRVDDNSVIFFDVYHKNESHKLKHGS